MANPVPSIDQAGRCSLFRPIQTIASRSARTHVSPSVFVRSHPLLQEMLVSFCSATASFRSSFRPCFPSLLQHLGRVPARSCRRETSIQSRPSRARTACTSRRWRMDVRLASGCGRRRESPIWVSKTLDDTETGGGGESRMLIPGRTLVSANASSTLRRFRRSDWNLPPRKGAFATVARRG